MSDFKEIDKAAKALEAAKKKKRAESAPGHKTGEQT